MPVSESLSGRVLSLPVHSEMTADIAGEIAGEVKKALKS
jgi:dTDP-4-amino-4,6-dideoxygalactose transaminase